MKRPRSSLKSTAAILALALAPCSALFAQDYEIRLDRPDPIGSKCRLAMVGKESTSQVVKQDDKVIQDKNSKFTVEAELVATILAVSEKGANTRVKVEVEKLTRIEGDARRELLPKGSVVTVAWDGKGQAFDMAGGLDPDTEESLRLLNLVSENPNGPTDDEVFGSKERKKVGDRWEGNSELMAKDIIRYGILAKKEDFKSTVTLDKVVRVGKTECLQLTCAFTCDKFEPPLPPGFTVEKSALKADFSNKLPVATSLSLPAEGSMDMAIKLIARGKPNPGAGEFVLEIANDQSLTVRATEVK
ncbi:MAG: hypothetical protein ABSA67_12625 [Candidatus Brocadiia bacterium]|jgi:hypothetical protein